MGELHCLDVGCGDATVIIGGGETFLIDCHEIHNFKSLLPADKKIKGVFITHQHEDHYSGLRYLHEQGYGIDVLIASPYAKRYSDNSVSGREWHEFNGLKNYFERHGTEVHFPYRQSTWDKPWWRPNSEVAFGIIGPYKDIAESQTREIHDASLVVKATLGRRACLFAGDASDESLERVAHGTVRFCGDILHASHHGSIAGAQLDFIKEAAPQYTVISTKRGEYENVPHPTALQRYDDYTAHEVYRTDVFGGVKWSF